MQQYDWLEKYLNVESYSVYITPYFLLFLHWQQRPSPGESSTLTDHKRWAISSQRDLAQWKYVCSGKEQAGKFLSLSLGSTAAAAQDSTQASQLEFTWHHKAPHYQLFVLPNLLKLVELGINFIPCENMQLFCALFHKQVDGWKTPLFLHQTSNLPINSLLVLKVLEKQMDEKSVVWT